VVLPQDGHVHSEWSWDAPAGDMERTCARAEALGLRSLVFTDHADFTAWDLRGHPARAGVQGSVIDGAFLPRPLDVSGYMAAVDRCRALFPDLVILSGVELGEAHLHPQSTAALLAHGFDRVLGSLHSLPDLSAPGRWVGVGEAFTRQRRPIDVIRRYLAEVERMLAADPPIEVLAHIDYAVRYWPREQGPLDPAEVEAEFRAVLGALAPSGRALEVNTRLPLMPVIVEWWHQAGGTAVTFGSDAHDPERLAWQFRDTAAMVSAHGFRPGNAASDLWPRA
jgi:histidinol-phosphatase (PHP family)